MGIGKFKARDTINPQVAVGPTQSVQQAGIVGRSLQNLGGQVQQFGAELHRKRKQAETNNFVSSQLAELHERQANIIAEARTKFGGDKKGHSDFVKSELERTVSDLSKNAPSNDASQGFMNRARSMTSSTIAREINHENVERAKFYLNEDARLNKDGAYTYFKLPDIAGASDFVNQREEMITKNMGVNYTKEQGQALIRDVRTKTAQSVVNGLVEMGRVDEAAGLVKTNYLGAFEAEQEAMLTSIDIRKMEMIGEENELDEINDREVEIGHEEQLSLLVDDILTASTEGERLEAQKKYREGVRSGLVEDSDFRLLSAHLSTGQQREISNSLKFAYTEEMLDPATDLDALSRRVKRDTLNGRIMDVTGQELLRSIDVRRRQGERSPEMKESDQFLKAAFSDPFSMNPAQDRLMMTQAIKDRDELIEAGYSLEQAERAVMKTYKGNGATLRNVPFIQMKDLRDPNKLKQNIAVLKEKVKNKEMLYEQARRWGRLIRAHHQVAELKDEKSVSDLKKEAK